jgi:hypothetical protein
MSIQYLATCAVRKRSRHYIYKPVKRTVSISLVIGSGTRAIIALTHFRSSILIGYNASVPGSQFFDCPRRMRTLKWTGLCRNGQVRPNIVI